MRSSQAGARTGPTTLPRSRHGTAGAGNTRAPAARAPSATAYRNEPWSSTQELCSSPAGNARRPAPRICGRCRPGTSRPTATPTVPQPGARPDGLDRARRSRRRCEVRTRPPQRWPSPKRVHRLWTAHGIREGTGTPTTGSASGRHPPWCTSGPSATRPGNRHRLPGLRAVVSRRGSGLRCRRRWSRTVPRPASACTGGRPRRSHAGRLGCGRRRCPMTERGFE